MRNQVHSGFNRVVTGLAVLALVTAACSFNSLSQVAGLAAEATSTDDTMAPVAAERRDRKSVV